MSVDTKQVKQLRDETGVSVMECKKALEESDGDIEKARTILKKKGSKAAEKKSDRDLGSGVVAAYVHANNNVGAMLELRCETDFVSRNEEFQALAYDIAMHIAAMNPEYTSEEDITDQDLKEARQMFEDEVADKPEDLQEEIMEGKLNKHFSQKVLLSQPYIKDQDKTIEDLLNEAVQKFGENLEIGQFSRIETLDR